MPPPGEVGVTGATGNIGGRVARLLAGDRVPTRLVVRDPSLAPSLPESLVVSASYGDFEAVRRALEGLTTVLMVSAAESPGRLDEHRTFIDAAAAAGVEHLVYTSYYGASPDATFTLARQHHVTEEHIKASGMAWTMLRDSLYLDFLLTMVGAA